MSTARALLPFLLAGACTGGQRANPDAGAFPPREGPTPVAACPVTTALFTTPPVAMEDLLGWVPLGNLGPPGHLFPTDHQYLYVNHPSRPQSVRFVNVVAPGDVVLTRAHRTHYSNSNTTDYALEFAACDEVRAQFGHVTTLAPALAAQLVFDQECREETSNPALTYSNCWTKFLNIALRAGEPIGTTGGYGTSFGLDFTLHDRRISPHAFANPQRWLMNPDGVDAFHIVPPSDYFTEPARTAIRARLGSYDGAQRRVVEPVGGTIAYDRPGTAQGVWMNPDRPTFPEAPHLAVVLDPVDPGLVAISMGTSQPGFPSGLSRVKPQAAGLIDRLPTDITADGAIRCYDLGPTTGALLLRLDDATTLRVEGRPGTTCAAEQPWAFGPTAFTYRR